MNKVVFTLLLVLGTLLVWALLSALPMMLLWNWLMPELFGVPAITFLQSLGMGLLASLLFKTSISTRAES